MLPPLRYRLPVKPPLGAGHLRADLRDGAYWQLSEGAGTTFNSLGRPLHLTNQVPTKITWGVAGGGLGLLCDGSVSNRADGTPVTTGAPVTLFAVFSTTEASLPYEEGIVSLTGAGSQRFSISMKTDFTVSMTAHDGAGNSFAVASSATCNDGKAHWAAAVCVAQDSEWHFYLDGVFQGSSTANLPTAFAFTLAVLGEDSVNNGQAFKGTIYAAGMWPRAIPEVGLIPAPYDLLAPIPRRYVNAAAAAATTTFRRSFESVGSGMKRPFGALR